MSLNDLRACRNALKKLKMNKHSALFLQAVDPIRDHAPKFVGSCCHSRSTDIYSACSYFAVIQEPMDLGTMSSKLETGLYKDRFAFEADFRLTISNAKQYNMAGSYAHNEAIAFETIFEKRK